MRISDWSSDVCSSDLERKGITAASHERKGTQQVPMRTFPVGVDRYRALREHKEFLRIDVRALLHQSVQSAQDEIAKPCPPCRQPLHEGRLLQGEPGEQSPDERRVGKGRASTGRSRWSAHTNKKKKIPE